MPDTIIQKKTTNPLANKILSEVDEYQEASSSKRSMWVECYRHYMSFLKSAENPFLANMFIPKTHEAVELLAAFLAGSNQTVDAEPEGKNDTEKAIIIRRWLEFIWRKVIKARNKVVVWIKQSLIFSNGIMKVWWDPDKNAPGMEVISLPDVYFEFYQSDIQDSYSVIHRVVRNIEDVKNDDRYNEKRKSVIADNEDIEDESETKFTPYDKSIKEDAKTQETQKVELYERWCKSEDVIATIAPTAMGYEILKKETFKEKGYVDSDGNKFYGFIKMRTKQSPLPNRAYDIGQIEPTLKLQSAFNDMINEVFDNVSLINNKMWVKRKGSGIMPVHLVRRPGGVITAKDVNQDIRELETSDIKQSALETLNILDKEFQMASMMFNLLSAMDGGGTTATEAAIGQQNALTLLEMVDDNVKEAMSDLGQMLVELMLKNTTGKQSIKLFDNDSLFGFLDFDVKEVDGKYDIKISADREVPGGSMVKRKQLLDLLNLISRDEELAMQYPNLKAKVIKEWMKEGGTSDVDYFFEEDKKESAGEGLINFKKPRGGKSIGLVTPSRREGLSPGAIQERAEAPLTEQGSAETV